MQVWLKLRKTRKRLKAKQNHFYENIIFKKLKDYKMSRLYFLQLLLVLIIYQTSANEIDASISVF
jgi:hypothetical protein